jgi:hypothetical protein
MKKIQEKPQGQYQKEKKNIIKKGFANQNKMGEDRLSFHGFYFSQEHKTMN